MIVNRLGLGAMRLTGSTASTWARRASGTNPSRCCATPSSSASIASTPPPSLLGTRSANELIDAALAPYPDGLVSADEVEPGP